MLKAAGIAAIVLAFPTIASAQTKLSREEAASIFGAREKILDASISPKGDRVALVVPGTGQSTVVTMLEVATEATKAINSADGKPMALRTCNWASDQRVVCSLYGITDRNYNQLLPYRRLISFDPDGADVRPLGAYERLQQYIALTDGYVVDWRDGKTDSVLLAREYVPGKDLGMSVATSMAHGLGVDLVDTRTGKVTHVESPDRLARTYIGDGLGNVRIMSSDDSVKLQWQSRGVITFRYRLAGSRDWKPFSTYNTVTNEGMYPLAVDGALNVAYVLQKLDGRDALYRVSLDGSMKKELAVANANVDISGVVTMGRLGRIVGAAYTDEYPRVEYFDSKYAKLVKGLSAAIHGLPMIRIVDSNADETIHIVHASSDTNPGRYYLYNSIKKSLMQFGEDRPKLAGVPLGAMKPITYAASDGTKIPAYLTLPPGHSGKGLPTIVMPHGGPASRDEWGFDWLVQFFVNRGYAVLQPNYRGSSGYGEGWFQQNGFRSWKTAIGDVNDAGRWLVKEGIADPAKLAIVGWSYGGYAALQANVLDADLFKAAIAIAPVTDLGMLRGENPTSKLARDYIGEGPQLKDGSPLQHPDAFRAPVLMFHGDKDINVGIAQSRAMQRALSKSGRKSELVTYKDIDHQLGDSAVRADMLTKADAFLSKSLGL